MLCGVEIMKNDIKRMLELWDLTNPTKTEIAELYDLCSKYPNVDYIELVNAT